MTGAAVTAVLMLSGGRGPVHRVDALVGVQAGTDATKAAAAKMDAFDAHCADLGVLMIKAVQKELGVTTAQRARMNVYADEHEKELRDMAKKYQDVKVDTSKIRYDLYITLKVHVLEQLSAGQLKRLRELSLQRIGLVALCDPIVSKRVGLSEAQTKKLRETYDAGYKLYQSTAQSALDKVLAPYKGTTPKSQAEADALKAKVQPKVEAARAVIKPKLEAIMKAYDTKMRSIMTAGQIATYESLRGKPFKNS